MELEDDDDDSEQGGVSLSQEPEQLTRLEPQNERVEGGTARPHKVVRVGEEEKELSGMSCGGTMKHEPKEEEDVLQNTSLDALDAKHEVRTLNLLLRELGWNDSWSREPSTCPMIAMILFFWGIITTTLMKPIL